MPGGRSQTCECRGWCSRDDAHEIVYFRRHPDDDPDRSEPGRAALNSYPPAVRAKIRAVLIAVAAAPTKRFAGGATGKP